MSSIATCIKKHCPKERKAEFTESLKGYQEAQLADKIDPKEARIKAVDDALAEYREEREKIMAQVREAMPKEVKVSRGSFASKDNSGKMASAMADISKAYEYDFKFTAGDKVQVETGRGVESAIVLSSYMENGSPRYMLYPPGAKSQTGKHYWAGESDLKRRGESKESGKDDTGAVGERAIPEYAKRAGIKTALQARKKGVTNFIFEAKEIADEIIEKSALRLQSSPTSLSEKLAEDLVRQTAIAGGRESALNSLYHQYSRKAENADIMLRDQYAEIAKNIRGYERKPKFSQSPAPTSQSSLSDLTAKQRLASARDGEYDREINPLSLKEHYGQTEIALDLEEKLAGRYTIIPWRMPRSLVATDRKGRVNMGGVPRGEFEMSARLAKIFGKEIVWISAIGDGKVNGMMIGSGPLSKYIFVDVRSPIPSHVVYGHELAHHLETSHQQEYGDLWDIVSPLIKDVDKYRKKLGLEGDDNFLKREIIADLLGDNFNNPDFWTEVAAQSPNKFRQIAAKIRLWINSLIEKLTLRGFGSSDYVTDLKATRKALAHLITKTMSEKQRGELVKQAGKFFSSQESTVMMSQQQAARSIFSKLEQVASVNFTGMKAQGVLNFLNKQGVKKAEIEATGLDSWLAGMKPTDKVIRDDLMNFVQANMVEVEDVVLSDTPGLDSFSRGMEEKYGTTLWYRSATKQERAEFKRLMTEKLVPTHFAQYTEPSADPGSYREMFVTAPYRSGGSIDDVRRRWEDGDIGNDEFTSLAEKAKKPWQDGHSQYSEIRNPIVRVRYNTETRDGKTYLRIEEMQGPSDANQQKMPAYLRDNIYNIGSKRIIAMAQEMGVDGIVFAQKPGRTQGETQADRYSLEKQISGIRYEHTDFNGEEDGVNLTIIDHGGKEHNEIVPTRKLADYVGKDMAQKITGSGEAEGSFSGLDLIAGGEGLKRLYDTQLPAMLESYAKSKFTDGILPITDKTPGSFPLFSKLKDIFKPVDTASANFKAWFGDSVVTENGKAGGKPLRVYHGTFRVFQQFDPEAKANEDHDWRSLGIWFTDSAHIASNYAADTPLWGETEKRQGGMVYPVYLSIKEPKHIKYSSLFGANKRSIAAMKAKAIKDGHDGFAIDRGDGEYDFVAFSPTQIKSAISNTGDFSRTDPRIKFSVKGATSALRENFQHPTTEAFKKWFGKSKITSNGKPHILYHGTNDTRFLQDKEYPWVFDLDRPTRPDSSPFAGLGIFLGNDTIAMAHSGGNPDAVHPVYVRVENPLVIASDDLARKVTDPASAKAFRKRAMEIDGYDGIIIKDRGQVVAFEPNQVKSARENSGAFSRGNYDIRYSIGKTAQGNATFLRDNFDLGYIEKSGLSDAKFIGKILSSPEYTFTKAPAAWRAIQVQYNRLDNKVKIEDDILGNTVKDGKKVGFVQNMEEGKKKHKADYEKSNNYLLETDKTGKGFTLKPHDPWQVTDPNGEIVGYAETQVAAYKLAETAWIKAGRKGLKTDYKATEAESWGVLDRKGKEVASFENEVEAVAERDRREYADLKSKGFSEKAISLVREYRDMTGRAFGMMIADLRKIIKDAKENGLDMPTVSVVDETKRWAVLDGGKVIATFETKQDAKQAAGGKHTVKEQKDADIRKDMKLTEVIAQMADLIGTYFARQRDRGAIILRATKDGERVMKKFDYHMMKDKFIDTATGQEYSRPMLNWMKGAVNLGLSKIPGTLAKEAIELKRQGYTVEVSRDNSMPESVFQAAQLVSSMSSLIEEARTRAKGKGNPKEVVEQGHKILMQALADIVKERGYMSSRLRRSEDYWSGFETDMLLSGTQYARGLAAGIAKKQAAKDFIAAITGTDIPWKKWKADYVEEGQEGTYEEYLDFVAKRRVNPTEQPQLHGYLMSWTDEMLRNEERVDRVMGTIKGLAIVKFLGFRLSSAAVNATNMLQAVPATIASQSGGTIRGALNAVRSAAVAYGKFRTTGKDISESDRAVLTEIVEKGWDVAQYNKEAAAVMQTKLGRGWDTFMEWSMKMFGAVEKANRSMTILAAYNEITKNTALDHDKAMELAKHVSDRAHGVYGKATRPQWAQGSWNPAQLAFVFMKFTQNYINNMYEMGVKGDFRAVSYMLLSPAVLAGAGASVVTPLVAALAQSLGIGGDDPEEEFYKWAEDSFGSDALFRHGLAGLAGINIKGSIQMNNPLPTTLWEAAGAPGSMVRDLIRGVESLGKGEYAKGIEALLPTAIGNISKGIREYDEGLTTGSYSPRYYGTEPLKADGLDATLRVLSFNPAGISKKTEQQYREKSVSQKYADERADINTYAKKLFIFGKGDREELVSMMMRYNEKVRGSGRPGIPYVTWDSIRSTVRRAQKPSKAEAGREM